MLFVLTTTANFCFNILINVKAGFRIILCNRLFKRMAIGIKERQREVQPFTSSHFINRVGMQVAKKLLKIM